MGEKQKNKGTYKKRILSRTAGLCCLGAVLAGEALCPPPACREAVCAASIQDRIDSAMDKIGDLEDDIDRADDAISTYEQQQAALEQSVREGQEKISRLASELDGTKEALDDKQEQIEETEKELAQSEEDSRQQYGEMKLRIRYMYENSTTSMLTYVLESGTFAEALRRICYFQAVMAYDRSKLEEYQKTTKKIKREQQRLEDERQELDGLQKQQAAKLAQIDETVDGLKEQLRDKLDQLQATEELRDSYNRQLAQQQELEEELERQKAEEDRQRMEEIRRQEEELERKRQEEEQRRQEEARGQEQQSQNAGSSGEASGGSGSSGSGTSDGGYTAGGSDLELLSTIIYCEAGSEPYEGQLAVGSVVMNRVASDSFPNSVSGVIYQSGQFSPVSSGRFAHALAEGLGSCCKAAAQEVLAGRRTVDCLYFRVDNGLVDGRVIGSHVFY